jgi:hypothetical protein
LRSFVLALRPRCLLLTLRRPLLWLLRLRLGSGLLRGGLALRSFVLALRPRCLLLTLRRPLLWLLRFPLGFGFLRAFPLRSSVLALRAWCLLLTLGCPLWLRPLRLGRRAGPLRRRLGDGPLYLSASLCLRLSARSRWRRRRGHALRLLRLIALLHYGVLRLVTVVLALKHELLLNARVSSP